MAVKRKTTSKGKKKSKAKSKEMIQTHAMEEKDSFEKTSLDQIWGDTGFSKYGTLDEEKYSADIKTLNKTDLHAHAVKMGILPVDNRQLLTSRLIREFKKYVLGYRKPSSKQKSKTTEPSDKVKSILAEGR
tara:strand:+ start:127 stop:519 length:393 start_codon:yes stop_codon:yes gene_type:complete